MRIFYKLIAVFVFMVFLFSTSNDLLAQKKKKKKKRRRAFVYKPKADIGAPTNREGAAARGPNDIPFISALVPDHIGYSSIDQPTIYWFIRKSTKQKIYFTLTLEPRKGASIDDLYSEEDVDDEDDEDEDGNEVSKPQKNLGYVFRTEVNCSKKSGIVGVSLKKYGMKLLPGRVYKWSVSGKNSDDASGDKKAFGTIKYVDPSKKEKLAFAKAKGLDKVQAYANNGMWYDTLAEFSKMIRKNPGDKELVTFRNEFLAQVGLNETVGFIEKK